ncbi:MAG: hypothetical protein FJW80_01900 [Actinobacteria bacterium]|nr:hypothetical protein [Actinomycetota bacterium]
MPTTLTTTVPLAASDRCDGCGAQAYVRVTLIGGGDLLFCGHHWNRHAEALRPRAVEVFDETDRLVDVVETPEA